MDPGLIRHRGKLEALVSKACAYLALEGTFSELVWSFVASAPKQNRLTPRHRALSQSEESRAMSRSLTAKGFRFVGPAICYAFMQSTGLVNDHKTTCHRYAACREPGRVWSG